MRLILSLLFLFLAITDVFTQSSTALKPLFSHKNYSIQVSWQDGKVFGTNEFLRGTNAAGIPINHYQVFSVRLARQTTGTKIWEQLYRYPRYGVGFFMADFHSKELGKPMSAFGFLTGPVFRSNRFSLTYNVAFGISFNWNVYDPAKNPFNIAVSSKISSMAEAGLGAEVRLLPGIYTGIETGFNHFSNGAVVLPNRGINCGFLKYNLRYDLSRGNTEKINRQIEKLKPADEWIIACYTGYNKSEAPSKIKPTVKQPTHTVFATGIFAIYHCRLNYRSKFGAGVEMGYIGLINPLYINTATGLELDRTFDIRRIDFSFFPSYELTIDKLAVFIQAGFYLYRDKLITNSSYFYQRVGCKYYLTDHLFAAIMVRAAKFMSAQFTEWSLGYRF